jgi:hypothetical protein
MSLARELFCLFQIGWMATTTRYSLRTNVFDEDWHALIILDACRTDAITEVASEYPFINENEISSQWSVGSTSKEWILKTFTQEYLDQISSTSYICGNSFSNWFDDRPVDYITYTETRDTTISKIDKLNSLFKQNLVRYDDFGHVEDLSPYGELNESGVTPKAETVTDHAVHAGRRQNSERMIVHYMQPHAPYLKRAMEGKEMKEFESNPWRALKNGESRQKVWNAYLDNLRYVLDSVSVLLSNLDANNVIITADHGELFGEFGKYGHGCGILHPSLKKVPWISTTATDTGDYTPELESIDESDVQSVDERLEALGYR